MDFICTLRKAFINLSNLFRRTEIDMSAFILYRIVDSHLTQSMECYKVQCINTKAVIELTLEDIIFDLDILHGLHPIQACFIGIEYAKIIKSISIQANKTQNMLGKYSTCRYGNNRLLYQDRSGYLSFICINTNEEFLMAPRDIALSRDLIQEFDAAQAFFIGFSAELKFVNPLSAYNGINKERPNLYLVKG